MGRVIPLRPGLRPVSASLAAAHWRQRADSERRRIAFHRAELEGAERALARCEALARLAENPTCPEPRCNETPGSPTCNEGDPREPA